MEYKHVSVLLMESVENLLIKPNGIYVDATLGAAGHSLEICKRLSDSGRLIGIDQDLEAHAKSKEVLAQYLNRTTFVHDNFSNISAILDNLKIENIDGFLMDLGVSSHQLDEAERGFSYMNDAPLDMRMDRQAEVSAYDVINTYSVKRLEEIIKDYGEERWARRIAEFIVTARKEKPIETTFELVSLIKKAVPKAARSDGPHPAKRTFQAIRIEVNKELEILQKTIEDVTERLNTGGRICAITFHSLEDRAVKNAFKELANPCTCPKEFPVCICNRRPKIKIITRKPILPAEEELELNHRARSAKLRVAEKLD